MVGFNYKKYDHPIYLIFLGVSTLYFGLLAGLVVCAMSKTELLMVCVIIAFVYLGLTLYTLQSRRDFVTFDSWFYVGLMGLIFNIRCVLADRISPGNWMHASWSLYMDVISMFQLVLCALLLTVLVAVLRLNM